MKLSWMGPWAAVFLSAFPAWSQVRQLTLDEALALARERGSGVALARGRVEEAQARQVQAGRPFQEDPVAELNGGYRRAGERFLDYEAAVSQELYAGRRRTARQAETSAAVAQAQAELADAQRRLLRDVQRTFVRLVVNRDRLAVLSQARQSAEDLLAVTERREEAGEATALELNRVRVAAAGARAEQSVTDAEREAGLGELKGLLGLDPQEPVDVQGSIPPLLPLDLGSLLAGLDRRPDLQALAAELRQAEAEILLGQAMRRPDVGVRGAVAREERADIVTAGVVLTLPVHRGGYETLAIGQARAAALRQALDQARGAAGAELRGLFAALTRQMAAARELETTALSSLEDNESLSRKSFEAGEIGLGELLLIRRETLETRLAYLDRILDAALTRIELEAAAGALP